MSVARCPHCEEYYDQDYNVEHEEVCAEESEEQENSNPVWLLDK